MGPLSPSPPLCRSLMFNWGNTQMVPLSFSFLLEEQISLGSNESFFCLFFISEVT